MRTWQFRRLVLATLAAIVVLVGLAGAAGANSWYDYFTAEGVNIRTGAATWFTSIGLGYTSHTDCRHYWQLDGEEINGLRIWNNHTDLTTNKTGFSHTSYMGNSHDLGTCD
jgi:hypothetical protein